MLSCYDTEIVSHLLIGTAAYPSLAIMQQAITASGAGIITLSLRRQMNTATPKNQFWDAIKQLNCRLLPNTAGCHRAEDAITVAKMAREVFGTHWVKLEVIGDDYNLQPDMSETIKAAAALTQLGFAVFPYCTDDLVMCKRLLDVGCRVLMPWAAPIGSGRGVLNRYALETLRARLPKVTLIIDAGIGKPSDATQVLEMGYDAVLVNSAIALADDPVLMAQAFNAAVSAGQQAHQAGCMLQRDHAMPSTPLLDTPFWQQQS